jgi:predicted ATPase/DNA-binding SARP family transcriptional activator
VDQFRLSLLGPFEASLDGGPLTGLRSSKGRGLLAYLASRPGFPHLRETLATLLWGEATDEAARLSLRVALSNLRAALGPLQDAPDVHPLLETTRHHVRFNADPARCRIDAVEFDALLATCAAHTHATVERCLACIERLSQAVNLYRGDFLADLLFADSPAFDEWRVLQQERYHRQTMTALGQIAHYHLALGEYSAVQAAARRQIELEPWHEEAHRQLMRSLALAGHRSAALSQFEAARHILAQELAAEPESETVALYQQIKAGSLGQPQQPARFISLPSEFSTTLTPFVGREAELQRIGELLLDPACRILTLVGLGGIGKTRLAAEAATRCAPTFADGAVMVSLDFSESPQRLAAMLLNALQPLLAGDEASTLAHLAACLYNRSLLLILDDCAPTLQVAGWMIDLLRAAPQVKILAAARQRLNVRSEWVLRVDGLDYPETKPDLDEPGEAMGQKPADHYSAVRLFVESARRVAPGYQIAPACLPHIVRICQLVQGMPLAIEAAAAWTSLLSCPEIAQEIQKHLDFLTSSLSDVPERQRSLRAVFDQTWNSLSPAEQAVFARLAVFQGIFDRAAAEAVVDAQLTTLASLVDKSLVRRHEPRNGRSEIQHSLHRVLQQYAREKLDDFPGEPDATRHRHSAHYLTLLAQTKPALQGGQQLVALAEIAAQIENIEPAWDWAVANGAIMALSAAWPSLFWFYAMRGRLSEGQAAFALLTAGLRMGADTWADRSDQRSWRALLGASLAAQGWCTCQLGHEEMAEALSRQSLELLRQTEAPQTLAFSLDIRAGLLIQTEARDEAQRCCEESLDLYRSMGDECGAALALGQLGQLAFLRGDHGEAANHCLSSLGILRRLGNRWATAFPLLYLGQIETARGAYEHAQDLLEEAWRIRREYGDGRGIALASLHLGDLARARGNYSAAQERYRQALGVFCGQGHQHGVCEALLRVAIVLAETGQEEEALGLLSLLSGQQTDAGALQPTIEALVVALADRLAPEARVAAQQRAQATSLAAEVARYRLPC